MAIPRVRYNDKKKRRRGSKFKRGYYIPINEDKYIQPQDKTMNSKPYPEYRSSWEQFYMKVLDSSNRVNKWGCEVLPIQYYDTQQNKFRRYFPDFFILLEDGSRHIHEIKPASQRKNQNNIDKWKAAEDYCSNHNITFRVVTEIDLKKMGMKI